MEKELIVEEDSKVNWEWIQGDIEVFFSVWPTIVLDLYNIDVESEKIVEFSDVLDQALMGIKDKDKKKSVESLAKLYSFLPEFTKNTEIEDVKKIAIKVKSDVLIAYAYVEGAEWDKVQLEVVNAEKLMSKTMTDMSKEKDQRKYNLNKTFILIEELKNSISTKDTGIFYIKYKNLIEELNTFM